MGRTIRMSSAQAIAAGLLDPEIASLVKPAATRAKIGKSVTADKPSAQGEINASGSPKKKRSRSRPASHPSLAPGPKGSGTVEHRPDGLLRAADFIFDVVPVPKERAQIVKNPKTDQVFGFTPARTKFFHDMIRAVVADVLAGAKPIDGPVRVDMTFVMQLPKSWPKWKKQAALDGHIVPTGRPDMDNLEKALLDAFNKVLIVDDALVIERYARKIYGTLPAIHARVEQTGQFDIHAIRSAIEARMRTLEETAHD